MLHILLDPSGAYLSLDYSLVCSHLESLLDRIAGKAPHRVNDPAKWRAYYGGDIDRRMERIIGGRQVDVEVRKTDQWLIMGRI